MSDKYCMPAVNIVCQLNGLHMKGAGWLGHAEKICGKGLKKRVKPIQLLLMLLENSILYR